MSNARQFVYRLTADSSELEAAAARGAKSLDKTTDAAKGLDRGMGDAAGSSSALQRALSVIQGGAVAVGLKQVLDGATALAQGLINAQVSADRLRLQLTAAVGGSRAGQEMGYVRELANRLGLELETTAVSYGRFTAAARGTSLEGDAARQVFESVSKAAAVMGLTTEETEGALRALEQMISKGTVQAEELRGQLGDRLPGALQIAARAMGVTTAELNDMVAAGQVVSSDFLPRFARQLDAELGQAAESAGNRMAGAVARMENAWNSLAQAVAGSGTGDVIKGQLDIAADALNGVAEAYARAREQGDGFIGQTVAAAGAALRFLNPFNAISYTAQSFAGQLQQAQEKLQRLKAELVTNPGNIFLGGAIKETEQLIDRLQQAQRAKMNLRAIDNATMERAAAQQEEAATRRRTALAEVTAELSGENSKYMRSLKVLNDAFKAGDLSEKEYTQRVEQLARLNYKAPAKGAAPKTADQLFNEKYPAANVGQIINSRGFDFRRYEAQQTDAVNEALRQAQLDAYEAQRQIRDREAREYEKRLDQAGSYAQQLSEQAAYLNADLITDAESRGRALIAIEKAQLQARATALGLTADDRAALDASIAEFTLARERQLTEDLKPEWQKRVEEYQRTTEYMKASMDRLNEGILDQAEDMWEQFVTTGKFSARSLVNYVNSELARLTFRQYLAPMIGQAGSALGGFLSGIMAHTGGVVGQGGGTPVSMPASTWANAPRYHVGGLAGDEVPAILRRGEEVLTESDPRHRRNGGAAPAATVVQHITYQVPAGMSPAAYAAALAEHGRQLKAEVVADAQRPGRGLHRAIARA